MIKMTVCQRQCLRTVAISVGVIALLEYTKVGDIAAFQLIDRINAIFSSSKPPIPTQRNRTPRYKHNRESVCPGGSS